MKYLITSLFVLLLFSVQANNKLGIIAKVPTSMLAGEIYNVEIIINKGDLASYAYFEQNLPAGITAEESINDNGDFDFQTGTLKIVWLRLPEKNQVRLVYSIQAPTDTFGIFPIGGTFNYIIGNKRGRVDLNKVNVMVGTQKQIDAMRYRPYDIDTPTENSKINAQIEVVRERPEYMSFDNSYTVILFVKKYVNLPLTIEEAIPTGYKASSVQTEGALFEFKKNRVSFSWDVLPEKDFFTVTYQLKKKNNLPSKNFQIQGSYTYKTGSNAHRYPVNGSYGRKQPKPNIGAILQEQEQQRIDSTNKAKAALLQNMLRRNQTEPSFNSGSITTPQLGGASNTNSSGGSTLTPINSDDSGGQPIRIVEPVKTQPELTKPKPTEPKKEIQDIKSFF